MRRTRPYPPEIRLGDEDHLLDNPFHAVMQYSNYRSMHEQCNTNLRHGDMHTLNVVVARAPARAGTSTTSASAYIMCWSITSSSKPYILFGLLSIQSSNLFARFITAMTDTTSLSTLPEDASSCADQPYDDLTEWTT